MKADPMLLARAVIRSGQARPASFVYFVRGGDRVKIGVSKVVGGRLAGLQVGNGYELELLAVVVGGRSLERLYHLRFARDRVVGEWFRMSPELMRLVDELRSDANG